VSSPRYFLAFNAALPRVFISALARTNLYRAIDSSGATIDFLLSAFRDADCCQTPISDAHQPLL
jgi:hypothetical protein